MAGLLPRTRSPLGPTRTRAVDPHIRGNGYRPRRRAHTARTRAGPSRTSEPRHTAQSTTEPEPIATPQPAQEGGNRMSRSHTENGTAETGRVCVSSVTKASFLSASTRRAPRGRAGAASGCRPRAVERGRRCRTRRPANRIAVHGLSRVRATRPGSPPGRARSPRRGTGRSEADCRLRVEIGGDRRERRRRALRLLDEERRRGRRRRPRRSRTRSRGARSPQSIERDGRRALMCCARSGRSRRDEVEQVVPRARRPGDRRRYPPGR